MESKTIFKPILFSVESGPPEAGLVLAAGPLDRRGDVVGHVHREEGAHAAGGVLGEVAVEGGGPVVEPLPGNAGL